jgi:acyl transferase domain-containing protein
MDPMLDAFEAVASKVTFAAPRVGVVSNLTGQLLSPRELTPRYWRRHVREAVRFSDGIKALHATGCNVVLELGPHPTLLGMAKETLSDADGAWVPSLRKGRSDWEQLLDTLGAVYVHGAAIDWNAFDRQQNSRKVDVPTYAFQRQRYWYAEALQVPRAAATTDEEGRAPEASAAAAAPPLKGRLEQLPLARRRSELLNLVRQLLASVSGKTIDEIPPEGLILDVGLDSLMTVEFHQKLKTALDGAHLPATLLFRYPTMDDITTFLGAEVLEIELDSE